jgi:putative ABC transport system substrate-binding protein
MQRRAFITLLGGAAATWPQAVLAQQTGKIPRIGVLWHAGSAEEEGPYFRGLIEGLRGLGYIDGRNIILEHRFPGESVASLFHALKDGLRELGYVEGRNIVFVQRYGDGKMERLPDLAAELVRVKVDVIVTGTNLHVAAVRHATSTIPVVMVFAADPVGAGFIASLARPGGNVTGLTADASPDLWAKYLGQLKEVVPKLSRVGVLGQVSSQVGFAELEAASRNQSVALEVADLRRPEDFNGAFATMISKQVEALLVVVGPLTY